MTKPLFELSITSVAVVDELPGMWSERDCRALLDRLEVPGSAEVPADELRDYCALALQDLGVDEASDVLVESVFGDSLSAGKQQNLSEEMTTDRLWEDYADLAYHERFYHAQFMLNQAFPETPQPEVNRIEAVLSGLNPPAEEYLEAHDPGLPGGPPGAPEALLVRCIAAALPENAILNRLFEDQLSGAARFAEAEHLLWQILAEALPPEGERRRRHALTLYSPTRWTGQLKGGPGAVTQCSPFIRDLED